MEAELGDHTEVQPNLARGKLKSPSPSAPQDPSAPPSQPRTGGKALRAQGKGDRGAKRPVPEAGRGEARTRGRTELQRGQHRQDFPKSAFSRWDARVPPRALPRRRTPVCRSPPRAPVLPALQLRQELPFAPSRCRAQGAEVTAHGHGGEVRQLDGAVQGGYQKEPGRNVLRRDPRRPTPPRRHGGTEKFCSLGRESPSGAVPTAGAVHLRSSPPALPGRKTASLHRRRRRLCR